MNADIAHKLFDLTDEFYQNFAASFAQTRSRIQPGASKILANIPFDGNWLDIGCGNGSLAAEWVKQGRSGIYCGLDASPKLIQYAQQKVATLYVHQELHIILKTLNVQSEGWVSQLPETKWDGVMMFAVMHHIPGHENRVRLCMGVHSLLQPDGIFIISTWQLQNSTRLKKRIRPWNLVGIEESEVDDGDVLLDWKTQHLDDSPARALRYVHLFSEKELDELAGLSGFRITQSFYSDGKEGNLGYYQIWQPDF